MDKTKIRILIIIAIIVISILLSNLPFDVTPNHNVSYQEMDVQMRKLWY